jgi:hypothetical protein
MTKATKKILKTTQTTNFSGYSFYSKNLNIKKFDSFIKKAEAIRDYKNRLSLEICSELFRYIEMSKFDLQKIFGIQQSVLKPSSLIRGNELQRIVADVFDAYQNKIVCVKRKTMFVIQEGIEVEYYKKNTKKNKKGDVRSFGIKTKSTPLTKSLTFLARYGSEDTLEYISNKILETDDNKKVFYETIKSHIKKYGLERLLKLALEKRERILRLYNHPIT